VSACLGYNGGTQGETDGCTAEQVQVLAYEEAFAKFEDRAKSKETITYQDVPWPSQAGSGTREQLSMICTHSVRTTGGVPEIKKAGFWNHESGRNCDLRKSLY